MPKHVFEKFSNTLRGNKRFWTRRAPDGTVPFGTSQSRTDWFWDGDPSSQNDGKHKKRRIKSSEKIKNFSSLNNTLLGIIFILIGLAWFVFLFRTPGVQIQSAQTQKEDVAKEPIIADNAFKKEAKESEIKGIVIPRLSIDLSVAASKIRDGYWDVSETSASHGEGSANPGEAGNVVVFAHAREGLFLGLRNIKKNDEVYLSTGHKQHKYRVFEITYVYPNDITTVAPTDSEVLTLFTCSGFFDEKRLIVKATPEKDIFW